MKVLVADDSRSIREHMVEMIRDIPGVDEVIEAVNGWDTVAAVLKEKVDVLILDIQMPLGNGLEVLDAIKTLIGSTTVIVMTAYPFPQYRKKCLDSGAAYFFDKAREFDMFLDVITQLARQHRPYKQVDRDGGNCFNEAVGGDYDKSKTG